EYRPAFAPPITGEQSEQRFLSTITRLVERQPHVGDVDYFHIAFPPRHHRHLPSWVPSFGRKRRGAQAGKPARGGGGGEAPCSARGHPSLRRNVLIGTPARWNTSGTIRPYTGL